MTLGEAIRAVRAKHPSLLPHALVEFYPTRRDFCEHSFKAGSSIFAYQFMTPGGRNVATYIPDLERFGGLVWQDGFDGCGRRYELIPEAHERIDWAFEDVSQA